MKEDRACWFMAPEAFLVLVLRTGRCGRTGPRGLSGTRGIVANRVRCCIVADAAGAITPVRDVLGAAIGEGFNSSPVDA